MLRFITKKISFWQKRNQAQHRSEHEQEEKTLNLSKSLNNNLACFREIFGDSGDVKIHEFFFGENCEFNCALIYIEGLVSFQMITESIIKPLIMNTPPVTDVTRTISMIKKTMLCSADVSESKIPFTLVNGCLSGNTILLLDGLDEGLIISTKGWDKRSITEPQTELVVRGPREGFTEDFHTNISLLRRKIKSPHFRMEYLTIGRKTSTKVSLAYLEGVANPQIIETARYRLKNLKVDAILDSGYIEEYIEDAPFSVFPTVGYSEKPDVIAAKILEGRVAIIVDGSPFVLTAPLLFIETFQTAEDYYTRPLYATVTRMMRLMAYFLSIFAVPSYIALTTFHQELIPTTLLFTIANAREGTPFPAFFEAFIMVYSFEILREAGLRLPRPVGQAISIVGALIMGDAAVAAGLVGAPMVIAVALTAVAGFVVPEQIDSISILRLILMILSAILGGFGITMGFLAILVHLATLQSFGVPYFNTVVPSHDLQDSFVRMPLWTMSRRPRDIAYGDLIRVETFFPPQQPTEKAKKTRDLQEDKT